MAVAEDATPTQANVEPEMRLRILPFFVAQLNARGPEVRAVLRRHGVPESAASSDELAMPLHAFRALSNEIATVLGDPFAGLHAAIELPRGAYGLLEFVLQSAPTVRDAVGQLVRFASLINNRVVFTATEADGKVVILSRIDGDPECLGRHGNEFSLALFLKVGRRIAGRVFAPSRVWLAHAAPPDVSPLVEYLGTDRLIFEAGMNALELDAALLELPVVSADPALYTFLDEQARAAAKDAGPVDELETVREKIRLLLEGREPTAPRVAAMLHVSTRSLQRRLAEKGTSFRALVDDVRKMLARVFVDDESRPLAEVAYLLGYSDVRSFQRAYKRWTGKTPGAERRS